MGCGPICQSLGVGHAPYTLAMTRVCVHPKVRVAGSASHAPELRKLDSTRCANVKELPNVMLLIAVASLPQGAAAARAMFDRSGHIADVCTASIALDGKPVNKLLQLCRAAGSGASRLLRGMVEQHNKTQRRSCTLRSTQVGLWHSFSTLCLTASECRVAEKNNTCIGKEA